MYISHNWLKEFVDFDYSPSEIDSILTGLGIEVEHIVDYTEKYKNFFIGHVLHHDKHPNADKLSVCLVDYGDGEKTIVCGAPNVAQGQKVVVGIPGACVPNSKIILEKRKVRNVESEGMICAQVELELGEDHDGIWILPESAEMGRDLYSAFVQGEIVMTDATTAEMVKLMENTYRDVNIAIANEFSRLADRFEINVWEAIEIANRHPRVNILNPGPGVGGHCISVDPWFLVEAAPDIIRYLSTAFSMAWRVSGGVLPFGKSAVTGLGLSTTFSS